MSTFSTDEVFKDGKWYHEKLEEGLVYSYKVKSVVHEGHTKFQKVEVFDTVPFSRLLITDGLLQSSYADEYVYHECLVFPALLAHGQPKRIFIAGGGEGATLRECLRFPSVEEVVMVDIDEVVVENCKAFMPNHSAGAFADKRTKLIIDDAKAQLETAADGSFDVIILDLCDPVDGGPCYQLYTTEFYTMCAKKLSPKGVLVTQSGVASIREVIENSPVGVFSPVYRTLKEVFPKVHGYTVYVPSFCSEWAYTIAFKEPAAASIVTASDIDAKLEKVNLSSVLKYYDQTSHTRMFALPKPVRKVLENEKRIMNLKNPLFMTASNVGIQKK